MYKQNNKRIGFIYFLMLLLSQTIFFYNHLFASDISISNALQTILNSVEDNDPASSILNGKVNVDSIYNKNLESLKQSKIKSISTTFQDMVFQDSNRQIDKEDLFNILYNSNDKIAITANWAINKNIFKRSISKEAIKQSYDNVRNKLYEKSIIDNSNNNIKNNTFVEKRVQSQFILKYENRQILSTISNAGYGEDLFLNGVESDSDYDLQIDIKEIGDIMFESFIAPIETVFYGLPPGVKNPKTDTNSNRNSKTTTKEELQTIITQAIAGKNESNTNTGVITSQNTGTTTNPNKTSSTTETDSQNKEFHTNDNSLQRFLQENQFIQKIESQTHTIQGDICKDGITLNIPKIKADSYNIEEIKQYIDSFFKQVEEYEEINPEDKNIPTMDPGSDTPGSNQDPDTEDVQKYVEKIMASEDSASCIDNCKGLPIDERTICQIQCLCFSVSFPQYDNPKLKSLNDSFKIKFCMIPVQNMEIPKGKSIYSLDNIISRIYAMTNNLINGGQMTKYQYAPEYLNSPLAEIKFSKVLSFQINTSIKPLFNNQPKHIKQEKLNVKIENIIEGSHANSLEKAKKQLDLNKYLVIANTTDVGLTPKTDPGTAGTEIYDQIIYKGNAEILASLSNFLGENYKFRSIVEKELSKINHTTNLLSSNFKD